MSSYKKFSTSNFAKKNQSLVSSYKKFSTSKFCKQQFVLGEFLQVVFHQQILWRIVEKRKKRENTYCNSSSFHQCGWHSIHIDTVELDAGGRQAHRHHHHQQQQMQQRSRRGRQRPELLTAGGIRLQASLVWASGRCICDTKQPSCSSRSPTHPSTHQPTKNHRPRSIPQKSDKESPKNKTTHLRASLELSSEINTNSQREEGNKTSLRRWVDQNPEADQTAPHQ